MPHAGCIVATMVATPLGRAHQPGRSHRSNPHAVRLRTSRNRGPDQLHHLSSFCSSFHCDLRPLSDVLRASGRSRAPRARLRASFTLGRPERDWWVNRLSWTLSAHGNCTQHGQKACSTCHCASSPPACSLDSYLGTVPRASLLLAPAAIQRPADRPVMSCPVPLLAPRGLPENVQRHICPLQKM